MPLRQAPVTSLGLRVDEGSPDISYFVVSHSAELLFSTFNFLKKKKQLN